jgi:spore germination cell wall hydrolase CwlJ-like protein
MEDPTPRYLAALFIFALLILAVWSPPILASDRDGARFCLAQNMYFEAGNQSLAGKIAVSQVVLNRVNHPNFPDNVCDVVYQGHHHTNWKGNYVPQRNRCQFSWYCDGKPDVPVDSVTWESALRIADTVLRSQASPYWTDFTDGALWYHADYVHPFWADSLNKTSVIDNHIFYK